MANSLIPRGFGFAADAPIELYNMLDDFFTNPSVRQADPFKVDVQESETGYTVEADLPGVNKDNIDIEMEDDKLTISVSYQTETNEEKKNYIHRERSKTSMSRSAILKDANAEDITAKLENGVLTVSVPKQAPVSNVHKISLE